MRYVLTATDGFVKYLEDLTMDQALKTIRNRIDQFGVAEPDIRKQMDNRIIVSCRPRRSQAGHQHHRGRTATSFQARRRGRGHAGRSGRQGPAESELVLLVDSAAEPRSRPPSSSSPRSC
jgi:preprotein translocase subunit SecD